MATLAVGVYFADVKGFPFNHYVPRGRNLGRVHVTHGGVCRNVVEDMLHVGEPVKFLSLCDESAIAQDMQRHLVAEGADVSPSLQVKENGIGMFLAIINDKGDLAGSVSQMPEAEPLEKHVHACCDALVAEADSIVLEFDLSASVTKDIVLAAARYQKKVYALVGNMSIVLLHPEYLKYLDCFICNEVEAGRLFNVEDVLLTPTELMEILPREMARLSIPAMVVTMGKDGAIFFDSRTGEQGHCPSAAKEVIDTTGAGDAFFAGFVAARNHGKNLADAVYLASELAAVALASEESVAPKVENFIG